MVVRATLCHIIDGDRILLKKANRGISNNKWNGPGGHIEKGETPKECAIREVFEETGLRMKNPSFIGKLYFFMGGQSKLSIDGYLFATKRFSGRLRSSEEGEVRWFKINAMPLESMWEDDKVWLDLMLAGKRFDAYFYYDKDNRNLKECRIKFRK